MMEKCPNCGAALNEGVWPPPLEGSPQPVPPSPVRLKTGSIPGDVALGIGFTVLFFVLCGVGVIAVPIYYSGQRKIYPTYARAIGWSYIVALVVFGGAFYTCYTNMMYSLMHRT
jgi:hypothetical protein